MKNKGNDKPQNNSDKIPQKIGDYILRQMHLNDFVVIEYSKEAVMMRYAVPNSISEERVKKNLLIDVKETSFEKAVDSMKNKLNKLSPELKGKFVY